MGVRQAYHLVSSWFDLAPLPIGSSRTLPTRAATAQPSLCVPVLARAIAFSLSLFFLSLSLSRFQNRYAEQQSGSTAEFPVTRQTRTGSFEVIEQPAVTVRCPWLPSCTRSVARRPRFDDAASSLCVPPDTIRACCRLFEHCGRAAALTIPAVLYPRSRALGDLRPPLRPRPRPRRRRRRYVAAASRGDIGHARAFASAF